MRPKKITQEDVAEQQKMWEQQRIKELEGISFVLMPKILFFYVLLNLSLKDSLPREVIEKY